MPEAQGTFLSQGLCRSMLGSLPRGLLFSGAQLSFHELVVSLVVDVMGWGSPALAVMGVPLGDPKSFYVLGATGPP